MCCLETHVFRDLHIVSGAGRCKQGKAATGQELCDKPTDVTRTVSTLALVKQSQKKKLKLGKKFCREVSKTWSSSG